MEMVTLHELSVMLDISVRVLRSRVRQLVQAGKFVEGQDWRRDDFKGENHFVWKVSPSAFMRETGLKAVAQPVTNGQPPVTQTVNQPLAGRAVPAPQPHETLIKPDTKSPGLEREMIDFLKDQVRVKDGQIADLSEQNKAVTNTNLKLTGQIVQQAEQIHTLLRITGGKSSLAELEAKTANQEVAADNQPPAETVNRGQPTGESRAGFAA